MCLDMSSPAVDAVWENGELSRTWCWAPRGWCPEEGAHPTLLPAQDLFASKSATYHRISAMRQSLCHHVFRVTTDRIPRLSIKINPLSEFCQVFCHHEERVNASPVFKESLTIISFTIIGSQVLFICNYRQLFSGHGLLYKLPCGYFTQ